MSDELKTSVTALAEIGSERPRSYGDYTDEDRYTALAAVDLNGGNVYRTAKALGIPRTTLQGWLAERQERRARGAELPAEKEKRGDLMRKLENLLHDIIEAAPAKLEKATFSQAMVGFGIGYDKVRDMRSQEPDYDPKEELCRILKIDRSQLPLTLELQPGEEIPVEFLRGLVIETSPNHQGVLEPVSGVPYRHPDFGILLADQDQSNLRQGYVRLIDSENRLFVFSSADLTPVEKTETPS